MGYRRFLVVVVAVGLTATAAHAQTSCPGGGCNFTSEAIPAPGTHTGERFEANRVAIESACNAHDTRLDTIEGGDLGTDGIIDTDKVTTGKILDGTIGAIDLASDAVTTAKILNANVTAAKVAADVATQAELDAVAVAKQAGPLTGAVTTSSSGSAATTLANDSVTTTKILDANVTAPKIGSDAVTTAKILNANVTAAKVAADVATQAELDAKSAATSTTNQIPKFSDGTGDLLPTNLTTDSAGNNFNVPGALAVTGTATFGGQALGNETVSTADLVDGTTDCIAAGDAYTDIGTTPAYWKCINATTNDWFLVGP